MASSPDRLQWCLLRKNRQSPVHQVKTESKTAQEAQGEHIDELPCSAFVLPPVAGEVLLFFPLLDCVSMPCFPRCFLPPPQKTNKQLSLKPCLSGRQGQISLQKNKNFMVCWRQTRKTEEHFSGCVCAVLSAVRVCHFDLSNHHKPPATALRPSPPPGAADPGLTAGLNKTSYGSPSSGTPS